jgi:hypothetical protein
LNASADEFLVLFDWLNPHRFARQDQRNEDRMALMAG